LFLLSSLASPRSRRGASSEIGRGAFSVTSGAPTVVKKNAGAAAENEVATVLPAPATMEAAVAT
jgi:hypothetical protein